MTFSDLSPRERAMLVHRWREVAHLRDHLWARRALEAGDVGQALLSESEAPAVEGAWDKLRTEDQRTALGQVFTPPRLARELARSIPGTPTRVLDPACGDGSLLIAMADVLVARGLTPNDALRRLEGWDRDPHALWLTRANLVEWAAKHDADEVPVLTIGDAFQTVPSAPVDAIIANPPYLEAKRMRGAAPGLREQLAERYPELTGAWDLYVAFLLRAAELLSTKGDAAFLVPNKVLQSRYARHLRAQWVGAAPGGLRLAGVVDCSMLQPRPFPGTSVYPVLLHLRRGRQSNYAARRVTSWDELSAAPRQWVGMDAVRAVGGEHPVFVPFDTWSDLAPLVHLPRLESIARVASTCSFHARGLRERFVTQTRPAQHAWPYLGGVSRAKRTEVSCFGIRWEQYWICFDQDRLKSEHKNPLPRIETFDRAKAILCQHALRVRAVADLDGRYVTKDVYPVAWAVDTRWSIDALVALFNSTVFTALYNTLFQGVRVSGETYHYLPAFLKQVPVPDRDHPALAELDRLASEIAGQHGIDLEVWDEADRAIAAAYGVGPEALQLQRDVHLVRVGAEAPASR